MYKWKHVGLLLAALAVLFFGLHRFALAMQADVEQVDNYAGWKIAALSPSTRDLDFVAPNNGWAVATINESNGYRSLLYQYDGVRWQHRQTLEDLFAWDIDMVTATDGWLLAFDEALGTSSSGKLYRFNGATWQQVLGPDGSYSSIRMLTPNDGYMVTATGLWHYDGSRWNRKGEGFHHYPFSDRPAGFEVVDADNIWYLDHSSAAIYKFVGATWQPVRSNDYEMTAFAMVNANDGWMVGGSGKIWRWNGSQWAEFASPAQYGLLDVTVLPNGQAWAVGWGDGLLHFNGTQWQKTAITSGGRQITMLSPEEGWLGMNLHIVNGEAQPVGYLSVPANIGYNENVAALADDAVWANTWRYDGAQWQAVPFTVPNDLVPPSIPITQVTSTYIWFDSIQMVSAQRGWAAGNVEFEYADPSEYDMMQGVVFRYDGAGWTAVAGPGYEVYRLTTLAQDDVWAVGGGGAIAQFNGRTWRTVRPADPSGPGAALFTTIDMLSPQAGWAAGNAFASYNGQQWQVSAPISGTVNSLEMVSESDGWAVGTEGRIWHYNGSVWQSVSSPTDYTLNDIDMVNATDGWAVGSKPGGGFLNPEPATGIILHYDGTAWNVVARTPSYPLYAISMADRYTGRIVGDWGLMLRLDLSGTGAVSGTVRDETGKPLKGIAVYAYRNTGSWAEAGAGVTNAQGAYAITLPTGEYRIFFRSPTAAYRSEYFNDRANFGDADKLTVDTGAVVVDIDATLAPPPPPAIQVSGPTATSVDPVTGRVTVMVSRTGANQVTFRRTITCSGGATPANVALDVGGKTFAMTPAGSVFSATLTIPNDLPNSVGPFNLSIRYQCGVSQETPLVGTLQLYDPSGVITDANGKPLVGAVVSLYRVPGAQPDQGQQLRDCRTVDTRPGGPGGDWSGVPAADPTAGVFVNPGIDSEALLISPDVNPQVTGTNGRFGWDVASGCWYVTVAAKGYETAISPLVGVPPAVTDLDLELQLSEQKIYLPTLRK